MTHASTRGGHAYLEGQAGTPSHLQITSGDVCPMPYYLYSSVFAWAVMDQPQMFPSSPANFLYLLSKQTILPKIFKVK